MLKKLFCDNSSLMLESKFSRKLINNKNKRSYGQFHLDFGQSDFNLYTCSTCGINYAPRERDNEEAHKTFHKDYIHGIPFKVYC